MNFRYTDEVSAAIKAGKPLVALESTVIAHGLPFPVNVETAVEMESAVREEGAIPATVAILDGRPTIGISESELKRLATGEEVYKTSIRDLPIQTAGGLTGATTVAATLFLAHMVGLKVFATGGIGGVHRGDSTDISADLPAMAGIPMITVCSGPKIVLDLGATREWLETAGVPVLGWQSEEFPAFYSRRSGLKVDRRVESARDVSAIAQKRDHLEMNQCVLVTVSVPPEHEVTEDLLEEVLRQSIDRALATRVSGKDLTPFLLTELAEQTGGETLEANRALLVNNARIAAKIAVEHCRSEG